MKQQGCGNAGVWTARKSRSRFSIAAHEPLEIAGAISTFPQPRPLPRGKVEIQSQDSPLSHALLVPHKIKPERRTQSPPVTLVFRLISGLENAGGSRVYDYWFAPALDRVSYDPASGYVYIGFRCAGELR